MNCPKCGHEQKCPCPACQSRNKTDKPWIWKEGELVSCGLCGHTLSANDWMNLEWEQYKNGRKKEKVDSGRN